MMANANVTMSFNTERDTRGVKPGTHLDEKEKQEVSFFFQRMEGLQCSPVY